MENQNEKYRRYTIEKNKVWLEVVDPKTDTVFAFKCVYTGKNKKECEEWVKGQKKD